MKTIRIGKNNQITIPKNVREKANLREGDYLEIEFVEGKITLIPKEEDHSWLDSPEWQERLKEAEEDVKTGRIKRFKQVDDLIKDLRS